MKTYDNIFKTLSEKNPKLLIPVINAIFSTKYDTTENLDLLSGEHHLLTNADLQDVTEIITDSCIRIKNKLYHIECQSNPDGSMIIRMVEYDFYIALENAKPIEDLYEMEFPQSAVLYLRHNSNTPDSMKMRIKFPNGENVMYEVPVIKTQEFSVDDILNKQLFFFVPYYILKYEKIIDTVDKDQLIKEYQKLYGGMKKANEEGFLNDYDMTNIIEFTNDLLDEILENEEDVRKEVTSIMGGVVLETYADRYADSRVEASLKLQAIQTAKSMIAHGDSDDYISELTYLSSEEIRSLKAEK
jgi:uncharacterized protein YaaQ